MRALRCAIRLRHAGGRGTVLVRVTARDQADAGPRLPLPGLLDSPCRLSKDMTRLLRPLLLVAALLFSQHAALLHGLAHAEREVTLATHAGGKADGKTPALDHGLDVCAAFGALAHALGNATIAPQYAGARVVAQFTAFAAAPATTRIVFDSRAPPYSV